MSIAAIWSVVVGMWRCGIKKPAGYWARTDIGDGRLGFLGETIMASEPRCGCREDATRRRPNAMAIGAGEMATPLGIDGAD